MTSIGIGSSRSSFDGVSGFGRAGAVEAGASGPALVGSLPELGSNAGSMVAGGSMTSIGIGSSRSSFGAASGFSGVSTGSGCSASGSATLDGLKTSGSSGISVEVGPTTSAAGVWSVRESEFVAAEPDPQADTIKVIVTATAGRALETLFTSPVFQTAECMPRVAGVRLLWLAVEDDIGDCCCVNDAVVDTWTAVDSIL